MVSQPESRRSERTPERLVVRTRWELAAVFGVNPRTVSTWLDQGMPTLLEPGFKRPHFDVARCVWWRMQRHAALEVQRATSKQATKFRRMQRKQRAQATREERYRALAMALQSKNDQRRRQLEGLGSS